MKKYLVFLFLLILVGCEKDTFELNASNNNLIGVWAQVESDNANSRFVKTVELPKDRGFVFNADGSLIDRKINSFCATPPIYENCDGTWSLNDSILITFVDSYNGIVENKGIIRELTPELLEIEWISWDVIERN